MATKMRDWEEDFQQENGQYMCTCHICKNTFIGYKRRTVCKVCSSMPVEVADYISRLTAELQRRDNTIAAQREAAELGVELMQRHTKLVAAVEGAVQLAEEGVLRTNEDNIPRLREQLTLWHEALAFRRCQS